MSTSRNEQTTDRDRLREARKLAGLTQGQAAMKMEMHRPTISEIEAGNRNVTVTELGRPLPTTWT